MTQRRLTAEEFRAMKSGKRSKFNATKTEGRDGRTYDSKLEAKVANELYAKKQAGHIVDYIPQFRVEFSSKVTWRCDFMVVVGQLQPIMERVEPTPLGALTVRFIEVKGVETDRWRIIQKLLQDEKPWLWERLEVRKK